MNATTRRTQKVKPFSEIHTKCTTFLEICRFHLHSSCEYSEMHNFCKNNPKSCSTFSRTTQKVRREDFAGFEMSTQNHRELVEPG
jgi:hypothetical protein